MKKNLILGLSLMIGTFFQAQNIEKNSFAEKDIIREAFSFSNSVCTKEVLVDTWKKYIKKVGGKVKGGLVSKVTGTDMQFSPEGEYWNGYFAYIFNQDNTLTIFTSFQNLQGNFLSSDEKYIEEAKIAEKTLEEFRLDIQKSCNLDEWNRARAYSISLSKEKIENLDKIMFLEKSIRKDTLKLELKKGMELSEKEQLTNNKIQQRITFNEFEIQKLKDRNLAIDEENKAQNLVIQGFKEKQEKLNTIDLNDQAEVINIEGYPTENNLELENNEKDKQFFDN